MKVIMTVFGVILWATVAYAGVALEGTQAIPDSERQWVFVTVTMDGQSYPFIHVAPKDLTGAALETYVKAQEPQYQLYILRDLYRGSPEFTTLKDMQAWIAKGCKVERDKKIVTIQRQPWTQKHPKSLDLQKRIEGAKSLDEFKAIMLEIRKLK